jgi:hypothetical protein
MPLEAPTPLPARASDEERDRAVRLLRESSAAGRISIDTYSRRIERAWAARSSAELAELTSDVAPRRRLMRWVAGAVEGASALGAEAEAAWRRPRLPRLALPERSVTIGRSHECDCVVSDPSVSRRHASFSPAEGGWRLADLGSTNGTRLNGWRLTGPVAVRPGDEVAFGDARFRVGEGA